jgi:hypothetical protein
MPEEAPQPWQTLWLSLQGWAPLFIGEEEVVATRAVVMTSSWQQQDWAVNS